MALSSEICIRTFDRGQLSYAPALTCKKVTVEEEKLARNYIWRYYSDSLSTSQIKKNVQKFSYAHAQIIKAALGRYFIRHFA